MEIDENGSLFCVTNADLQDGTLDIPASVKYIAEYGFLGCTKLRHLKIPEGVIAIGEYAFRYCNNLTTIEIPNSVRGIRKNSFDITDVLGQKNPLKTIIVTPERKLDEGFKSYFPPKVTFVVKGKQKSDDGLGGK